MCRYPVILILLYDLGDFTGKMTPVVVPAATVTAPMPILACAVARLAFVPAYYFAAHAGVAPAMMVLTALLVRPKPRIWLLSCDTDIEPVLQSVSLQRTRVAPAILGLRHRRCARA